jgi:two-component system sensor histidine kinase MtrB
MPAAIVPRRFRTRLNAAFVLVAGVTSGLFALGSFLSIKQYRHQAFVRHADDAARLGLLSAPSELSLADFEDLLSEFRARAGFETVALVGDVVYSSSGRLGAADVPRRLLTQAVPGEVGQATTEIDGVPYLVIGGTPAAGTSRLFFFFDRSEVVENVRQVRNILAVGWLVAVAAAALVGHLVARRTLRPVAQAADAAQSLADGLLQTRLPRAADDEFGAWARSFNRMAAALEEKIGALSAAAERERRFTADVAHELRTPLTAISSAATVLAEELDRLPEAARRPAELLIGDVGELEGLLLELLELARLDAGQDDVRPEELSLRDAVGAVVAGQAPGAVGVRVDVPADLRVVADRARFRRVLTNLLANAVEHGGGDVEVVARRDGDGVAVDVLDRGPGLSREDLARVFERFYKADTARSRGGSGLGLAIALEHARAQGGSLVAANRPDGGARFTLRLPGAPAREPEPEGPAGPSASTPAVGAPPGPDLRT